MKLRTFIVGALFGVALGLVILASERIAEATQDEVACPPGVTCVNLLGQITDPNGGGIRNATVRLTDQITQETRATQTSSLGYYGFPDLEDGKCYDVAVTSRRYRFHDDIMVCVYDASQGDITLNIQGFE